MKTLFYIQETIIREDNLKTRKRYLIPSFHFHFVIDVITKRTCVLLAVILSPLKKRRV